MMDEIDLVNIENRALATANPRIIRPIRIEIMGKIVAEDVPKLCEEVRRCWLVMKASEQTGLKLAGDIKKLLEGMAKMAARIEEKDKRIAELEAKVKVMEYTIIDKCSDMSEPEKQIVDLRGRNRKLASKLTAAVMEVARLAAQVEAIQGKE